MSIDPAPVPTEWGIGHVIGPDGRKWYHLTFATAVGTTIYWFDSDAIGGFIRALQQESGQIVVPPSSEVRRFARELRDGKGS